MIGKIKTIRAFTLIELLMVISIISLLSSIVLGYVGSARAKSRDSVRLSDMQQINTAANMYRDDKNEVPDSIEMLVNTGYLSAVPKDPSTGISYSSKSISTSKGKVFIASTTYETIKREDGENQSVGVVVGDLTLADICIVLEATDSFPNCSEENPTDQIVGLTRGSRLGTFSEITYVAYSSGLYIEQNNDGVYLRDITYDIIGDYQKKDEVTYVNSSGASLFYDGYDWRIGLGSAQWLNTETETPTGSYYPIDDYQIGLIEISVK